MAQYRTPNQLCQGTKTVDVEDGTTTRTPMCAKGLVDRWHLREYDRRLKYVKQSWGIAADKYVMRQIIDRCEDGMYEAMKEMSPVISSGMGTLIEKNLIGVTVGGATGLLVGGITALPASLMGSKIGFLAGSWLLGVCGLSPLIELMQSRFNEIGEPLRMGIYRAWKSEGCKRPTEDAANELAEGVGRFFEALEKALTIFITRAAQHGSTQVAMQQLKNSRLFRICPRMTPWFMAHYPSLRKEHLTLTFKVLAEGPRVAGSSMPAWIRMQVGERVFHVERNAEKVGPGNKPIGPAMKHLGEVAQGANPWSKAHEVDFPMLALAGALDEAETELLFAPPMAQAKPKVDGWELLIDTRGKEWKVYHALPTTKPKW